MGWACLTNHSTAEAWRLLADPLNDMTVWKEEDGFTFRYPSVHVDESKV